MAFVQNILIDGLLIGLTATIAMTALMLVLRRKMDVHIAEVLGELVLKGKTTAKTELTTGLTLHIIIGILLGLVYVLLFPAGILFGLLYTAILWLVLMLGIMPLAKYGIFAKNLDNNVWIYTLIIHAVYGALLGFIAAI